MNEPRIQYPVEISQAAADRLFASVPAEAQDAVMQTSHSKMVSDLAKPGETIRGELTFTNFVSLLQVCAGVINRGNALDTIKKQVVYNKTLPAAPQYELPSSAPMATAFDALTADKAHLLHMAVGLAGEAAEMLNQIVDHILGAPLDEANVVEEAGDSVFYIQGLIGPIGVSLGEVRLSNKAKLLGKRFAKGYSDAAAQARADKPAGE